MRLLWLFAIILAAALAWWDWQDSAPEAAADAETSANEPSEDVVDVEVVEQ